jgi:uncharacterized protein (TIGR01777 family)
MKIAISGATGFIGRHLVKRLTQSGHQIVPLSRQEFNRGIRYLSSQINGCDGVINLAGAPINRRWTAAYKRTIVSSRIETTRLLVGAMQKAEKRPKIFISTSAMGAFSSDGRYTENDKPNADDFLGNLSVNWESMAREADALGIKTIIFRLSLVLGADGGLMKQLLLPFRLGLGGPVASGTQHFSWIHIDDLISAYLMALENPTFNGTYHLAAPAPVNNLTFTRSLGRALKRPTLLPVPAPLLSLIFGEGAEVMTSGQCIVSERLPQSGFEFRYPELDAAVDNIVKHSNSSCDLSKVSQAKG